MPDPIAVDQRPIPGARPAPDAPGLITALHATFAAADGALREDQPEAMLRALHEHGYTVALADERFDGMALYSFLYPYNPDLLTEARAVLYDAIATALDTEADRLRAEVNETVLNDSIARARAEAQSMDARGDIAGLAQRGGQP